MRVAVGLSGGVDSSVAASILKEQGHDVIGIFMNTWPGGESPSLKNHGCYGPRSHEISQAGAVAKDLGIPFHVLDLSREFKEIVLDYFRLEYLSGRTPNPCLRCNPRVKFGVLLDKARTSGIKFDKFATGHYAWVEFDEVSGRYILKRAMDHAKDQSYGLIFLSQEQLSNIIFPLGGITKQEVRKIARKLGLASRDAPESQDFYGGDIADLIGAQPNPGRILDTSGKEVGTHDGIWQYTIGQRRGLGVAARHPAYVKCIDPENNVIIVGNKADLYSKGLIASQVNYISIVSIPSVIKVGIRIRHTQDMIPGTAEIDKDGNLLVLFNEPQWAVAPGQAVGIYSDEMVLAGGIIEESVPLERKPQR